MLFLVSWESDMKRYFKCTFERTDEMYVVVETEETGDIAHRIAVPDEVGSSWFEHDYPEMTFSGCEEVSADEATGYHGEEPPVAEVMTDDDEELPSSASV
jgi:hypothetical protein